MTDLRKLYAGILAYLCCLIALFTWFTRSYNQ